MEFFMIIALFTAAQTSQCTAFLYKHGKRLYTILSHSSGRLFSKRFASFATILGVSETTVLLSFKEFSIDDEMDEEQFFLVSFALLDKLDKAIKSAQADIAKESKCSIM
jgi:hypothetical protein